MDKKTKIDREALKAAIELSSHVEQVRDKFNLSLLQTVELLQEQAQLYCRIARQHGQR
jgi:hypothetical protein